MNDGGRLMVFLSSEAQAMPRLGRLSGGMGVGMTDIVVGDSLQYVEREPVEHRSRLCRATTSTPAFPVCAFTPC